MVESLKKLNKICQKPRYREVGNWMVRHILRDAALPVTWLLLHTPVTADQVTLFSLAVGIAGIVFIAVPSSTAFLAGVILLQLWYFLDHVDGQIARYRKTASLTGRFFDFIVHHVIHGTLFFSLGVFCFQAWTLGVFPVVWAYVASIAMIFFNISQDVKYKTFFEHIAASKQWEVLDSREAAEQEKSAEVKGILRRMLSLLHKSCEIHVMMNVLTVTAVFQAVFGMSVDGRGALFLFYGLAAPFLAVSKIGYWIFKRKIDADFETRFRRVPPG